MVFHSLAYRVVELAALCSFFLISSRAAPLEKTLASVFGLQARHVGLTESTTIRPPTPKYSPYRPYGKSFPLPSQHFALSSCILMYCHLHSKKDRGTHHQLGRPQNTSEQRRRCTIDPPLHPKSTLAIMVLKSLSWNTTISQHCNVSFIDHI